MELTLGPVLFDWNKTELLRFYEEAADMEVDTVYIGEVVCAKRNRLNPSEIEGIATTLQKAGKKVVASSLALVSNEEELQLVREVAALPLPIEANDISMLGIVDTTEKEVFAGPHLMTYNREAVRFLEGLGVKSITFPVELPASSIAYNLEGTDVQGEVFAHGKLPLAMSWRCYSSRLHGLSKAECQHHCSKDPDGLELRTMPKANEGEGEQCFTINGTSIMSALPQSLIEFTDELDEMGVSALRISPHYKRTKETLAIFRERIAGNVEPKEALAKLTDIYGCELVNGWYLGKAGNTVTDAAGIDATPARLSV
jgi:collagenase-like PrtC family protease